ncbi:SLC13 family permease [Desulfosporosinus sp. SYSU MS00001]|uniref:SLC13 family permease n=1 Tax=Desulfosporosinus sp. SYSU MS00001 TaxID=3416284 RepID=UPI003CE9156C
MSNNNTQLKHQDEVTHFNRSILYWFISLGIPLLILFIPTTAHFTSHIKQFFALSLGAIFLWAFEIVPNLIVSLLLPVVYMLLGLAPTNVVFSAWSNYIPWLVLSGMILTSIAEETGLLKRVACWCILITGGSYRGIIYGLTIAGVILSLTITDLTARVLLFATISYSICQALELENGGKASSGIMLAGIFSALNPGYIFFTSASQTMIAYQTAAKLGVSSSWTSYLVNNGLITLIWCFLCAFILDMLFKSERNINSKAYFIEEKKKLGKLSLAEKKMIVILALIVIAILTEPYHKVQVGWLFPLFVGVIYLPGVGLAKPDSLKKLNFSIIIFVTATLTIGAVASSVGGSKFLADLLTPIMSGSKLYTLTSVWVFGIIIKFLMTPLAALATLTEPIVRLAQHAGVNPVPVLYVWNQSMEQVIFPYEYALVLLAYSYGYLSLKNLMKAFSIKLVFNIIFIIVIAVPFWKLIGLF